MSDRGKMRTSGKRDVEGGPDHAAEACGARQRGARQRGARQRGGRARGLTRRATLAGGLLIGAGVTYFFDACQGKTRRARLRAWLRREGQTRTEEGARPLPSGHPLLEPGVRSRVAERLEASADEALAAQARAAVAKTVARPDAVAVTVSAGIITLRGAVAPGELKPLLRRVADVRGVEIVENKLEVWSEVEQPRGISPQR